MSGCISTLMIIKTLKDRSGVSHAHQYAGRVRTAVSEMTCKRTRPSPTVPNRLQPARADKAPQSVSPGNRFLLHLPTHVMHWFIQFCYDFFLWIQYIQWIFWEMWSEFLIDQRIVKIGDTEEKFCKYSFSMKLSRNENGKRCSFSKQILIFWKTD